MTDEQRVIEAAVAFAEAQKNWAKTLPHKRMLCDRVEREEGPSCYVVAMDCARADGSTILDEDTEGWCEACKHNRRMALARPTLAAKRNGALMKLMAAVKELRRNA